MARRLAVISVLRLSSSLGFGIWSLGFVVLVTVSAFPEELWLYDNTRVYGLVQGITEDGKIEVQLGTGREELIPLENVICIRFLGRDPVLAQSGTQEFRLVNGGRLRGQILENRSDQVGLETTFAGTLNLGLAHFRGFLSLPLAGFAGRKAEELIEGDRGKTSPHLDIVLDRRGGYYPGVIRKLERTEVLFDMDEFLQVKPIPVHHLKGVRLADSARDERREWAGDSLPAVFLRLRDGSVLQGKLDRLRLGKWSFHPTWDAKAALEIDLSEIVMVQTFGGRVQYLSQLTPVEIKEQTILAAPQPHQMDRSSQGDDISIAGVRYPWGIGVHANSELTFVLGGRYQEFRSDVGIATRMGAKGSVEFLVLGDGRELFKSPVVKGSDASPVSVRVPLAGVQRLTLKVTDGGDLDMGDVANWGSVRAIRGVAGKEKP